MFSPEQLHSYHRGPPFTTCIPHHQHCSSPSLPQLRKWHLCSSNCFGKNFDSYLSPLPHIQSISILILWILPLKHTQHLITSQHLHYHWVDPCYHYLFWDHCESFLTIFYLLTCLLQSIFQTAARVVILKHKSKPSSGFLAHSKENGKSLLCPTRPHMICAPPPTHTFISYPTSYHFYLALLFGNLASLLFIEQANMYLPQGLCTNCSLYPQCSSYRYLYG